MAATLHHASVTYGELAARSRRLAQHLLEQGVGPDVAVGVCLRPSVDVLVALLAIWQVRGVYLPLDPTHPEALVARMIEEARPRLVLTSANVAALTRQCTQLCLDTDAARTEEEPSAHRAVQPSLDDVACLFYTSGTTGRPKGVALTQGNVAHYLGVARDRYGFRPTDTFVSVARTTFSISLFELLSPLCCGGRLKLLERDDVLAPTRFSEALDDVTVLHAGPSLLGALFRHLRATPAGPKSFPRMRHASSGGDMVLPWVMEEMKVVFPNAELFVIYGCTEIACMGTTFEIARESKVQRTFVGKPFPGVALRLLDPDGSDVGSGEVGEIVFAGNGVARGYFGRPELTQEKFGGQGAGRFYRAGDMGRMHEGGDVEILGRRDFQVQIHGIRIELAGIEAMILELGLGVQCAVVAKTAGDDDVRLVAFVVKPSVDTLVEFRQRLAAQLPDYSLPHHVVVLEAMPLTANGKLDRARLKDMPWETQLRSQSNGASRARTDRERAIESVFSRLLGRNDFGIDDNFFDLGGDSLRGVVAIQEIAEVLGVTIAPHILFEKGTVRALADITSSPTGPRSHSVLLGGHASNPPVFALSGIHTYRALARRLDEFATYGVFVEREVIPLDSRMEPYSVEELAREYRTVIERRDPEGPYRLIGYSFAGLVAYEVAQQLIDAGKEVHFLGLIDALLPEWILGWRFRLDQIARLPSARPRDIFAFLRRRFGERHQPPTAEFMRYRRDARLGPLEEQRDALNRRAAESYMPRIRPYRGRVTLVTSGVRLQEDPLKSPTCGWDAFVSTLDLRSVHADHFRLMSDEPYVGQLAEILARDLRA